MTEKETALRSLKKRLRSGYPVGEIRNEFIAKGYSAEEVNGMINELSKKYQDNIPREYQFNDSNSIMLLAGVTMIILGLGLSSVGGWNTTTVGLIGGGFVLILPKLVKMIGKEFKRKEE